MDFSDGIKPTRNQVIFERNPALRLAHEHWLEEVNRTGIEVKPE